MALNKADNYYDRWSIKLSIRLVCDINIQGKVEIVNSIKCGLIQSRNVKNPKGSSLEEVKEANILKHEKMINKAGEKRVQILCLQELFNGPYFCAEQNDRWYAFAEKVPEGPTIQRLAVYTKKYNMVLIIPVYEEEIPGVYYNTAAVIDADGKYLGKYRKNHIPQCLPGFWEKFYIVYILFSHVNNFFMN